MHKYLKDLRWKPMLQPSQNESLAYGAKHQNRHIKMMPAAIASYIKGKSGKKKRNEVSNVIPKMVLNGTVQLA